MKKPTCAVWVYMMPSRTHIDRRAPITTLYHQAANRLREAARGAARHGSCGVGIGETVADVLRHGADMLYAGDLPEPRRVMAKLRFLRDAKWQEIAEIRRDLPTDSDVIREALALFEDESLIAIAADNYAYLTEKIQLVEEATALPTLLNAPGTVIFEGAQGALLDETHGFAPYTTWSNTTCANALHLLADYPGAITRLGVLRTYFTRHGAGPFITEDTTLSLPEMHNATSQWQGGFRVGYFDLVAARYALTLNAGVDALAITHTDRLLDRICTAYRYHGDESTATLAPFFQMTTATNTIHAIKPQPDTDRQHALTRLLSDCTPVYQRIAPGEMVNALAAGLGVPVAITSHGPKATDKHPPLPE